MATKECLYSGHAAVKRSAMGVIIPINSVKLSRDWMFIECVPTKKSQENDEKSEGK